MSAAISAAVWTVPFSVAWVIETGPRCGPWTPRDSSASMASRSAAGVILARSSATRVSLAPPVKNSGALHSSSWICAILVQKIVCQGRASVPRISEFAAVPVGTR